MNMYWNETAKQTGVADKISAGKAVLLALYNSGPAQKRIIKINVPNKDLKIVDWTNQPITGDIFCANLYDTANCELIFSASLPESANYYIKIIGETKNPTAKVVKLKQLGALDNIK